MWGSKRSERASRDRSSVDALFDSLDTTAEIAATTPVSIPEPKAVSPEAKTTAPEPTVAAPEPGEPARKSASVTPEVKPAAPCASVLGRTLHFRGELSADEDLVLQGCVEGSITHTRSLTIGPEGCTIGDVVARDIVVEGRVEGDLHAETCVTVCASGSVRGSIIAPRVALADGASFNGQIDMESKPSAAGSRPARRTDEHGKHHSSSKRTSVAGG